MDAAATDKKNGSGGVFKRAGNMLRPGESALHIFGITVLVLAVVALVLVLVASAYSSRSAYFHKRNLRELDRIAATVSSATETLHAIPALHFVPAQVDFSLSPKTRCLVATTSIGGGAGKPIDISYHMVPPQVASTVPPTPPAAGQPAAEPCRIPAPAVLPEPETTLKVTETHVTLSGRLRLSELIWPNTHPQGRTDLGLCAGLDGGDVFGGGEDWEFILRCFAAAAEADLKSRNPPTRTPTSGAIGNSLQTAIDHNAIWVEASTTSEALDLGSSLSAFDAVMIVRGSDGENRRPQVIFQAGQVPPLIQDAGSASASILDTLLDPGRPQPNGSGGRMAGPGGAGNGDGETPFQESSVHTAGGLVIFQRQYGSLAGLPCTPANPCRLVGVVEAKTFNRTVRQINGIHATGFLIGVLSVLALLPLIHLALRKRLDPMGPAAQYVLWFSLTLIAASAAIAALTFWANGASRTVGSRYTGGWVDNIRTNFHVELGNWIERIGAARREFGPSDLRFPAPVTVPSPMPAADAGVAALLGADPPGPGIVETVELFRADGYNDTGTHRVTLNRYPAFGTNVRDRGYFTRAAGDEWRHYRNNMRRDGTKFVLDRIVARPDGMVKTVMMLDEPGGEAPSDRTRVYHPDQVRFVLATGHLQTFMAPPIAPGFEYAVIDPSRPRGRPNVLFHSRRDAELVEIFERELDATRRFSALAEQALADPGALDVACLERSAPGKSCDFQLLSVTTDYRAEPVRVTVTRLHPSLDWLLVVIEQRGDAGMAAWRAASFGYLSWLVALLMLALLNLLVRLRNPRALDRRPGLWLWPRAVLADFTPFRSTAERDRRDRLIAASHLRDRHIGLVSAGAFVGTFGAEGLSRVVFALGAVLAAFSARSYFRGLTARSQNSCRKLDRYSIYTAAALILLAIPLFLIAVAGDHDTSGLADLATLALRCAAVFVSAALLGRQLARAYRYTEGEPKEEEEPKEEKSARRESPRFMRGWMLIVAAIGGAPAAAGFLDSIDHDFALIEERIGTRYEAGAAERSLLVTRIDASRPKSAPIPQAARKTIVAAEDAAAKELRLSCATDAASRRRPCLAADHEGPHLSFAGMVMSYPGLHARALEFSDQPPFHMRATWAGARHLGPFALTVGLIAALLMLAAAAFGYFRRQYFRPSPQAPPGKAGPIAPPLTCTRDCFIKALKAAARGEAPKGEDGEPLLPFRNGPGKRHLMLGADLDIRLDEALAAERDLISWVDLLDLASGRRRTVIPPERRAIVVGNLDIALQLPGAQRTRMILEALETLVESTADDAQDRYVFILAELEPLDRIALLRERTGEEAAPSLIDDWRWAALLQDFALCTVKAEEIGSQTSLADRELLVLNNRFAHDLHYSLPEKLKEKDLSVEEEEMLVAYIAEQLGDYYHKLWASSSDEERVILYHLAWRAHLKMEDSRAVRSLLARGLIVRTPEYRLMNKSFARYVRRVERSALIRIRAARANGIDQIWPLIRYPLAALVASLLVVLQLVAPGQSTGPVGLLPALGAAVPALLANWVKGRSAQA